eukprot:TRINITY_DN1362_c0_g1_i2.p1 TRINITY_DN1362_c0_g1~~TRINITY_DN1362_c0_g1_i2.p1  ORF type:complete len:425 (+),score=179.07 TRINITY_DN1362_c0_g1_i2:40-1314(+)
MDEEQLRKEIKALDDEILEKRNQRREELAGRLSSMDLEETLQQEGNGAQTGEVEKQNESEDSAQKERDEQLRKDLEGDDDDEELRLQEERLQNLRKQREEEEQRAKRDQEEKEKEEQRLKEEQQRSAEEQRLKEEQQRLEEQRLNEEQQKKEEERNLLIKQAEDRLREEERKQRELYEAELDKQPIHEPPPANSPPQKPALKKDREAAPLLSTADVQKQLEELEKSFLAGNIGEEEYETQEDALLELLVQAEAREAAAAANNVTVKKVTFVAAKPPPRVAVVVKAVVPTPATHSAPQSSAPSTSGGGSGSVIKKDNTKDLCHTCGKTVFLTEKLTAEGVIFHKACFRCTHCNNTIKLGNYASLNGRYYCKPHFKQLFASKGNYNEGFGQEKLTHEWAKREGVSMESLLPGNVDATVTESSTTAK